MSLLWARVAAWSDASPTARERRMQRAHDWIDRQKTTPNDYAHVTEIPDNFGRWAHPEKAHEVSRGLWGGNAMLGNVHTHHLPWKDVPLDGTFHHTQPTFIPGIVHHKIDSAHIEDEYPEHDEQFDEHEPTQDPIVVHHQGQHYLLDGHHRFVEHRLLGKPTMQARVFDADDPKAGPEHCYECDEHKEYCSDCGGTPDWERD
jgi:hypothetical protein